MEYTPQEVAKLLANRPHQPHYVEWLIEQCLKREMAAERERWANGAARMLAALDALDRGAAAPGFRGWQNGDGEDVGDEVQDAREALAALASSAGPNCEFSGAQRRR